MESINNFDYMMAESLVDAYMDPTEENPLEAMENPEKIERRRTRNANMRHKARDIRRVQELGGDGFSGARRLKTAKSGKLYTCEGKTAGNKRVWKRLDKRARRREAIELDMDINIA